MPERDALRYLRDHLYTQLSNQAFSHQPERLSKFLRQLADHLDRAAGHGLALDWNKAEIHGPWPHRQLYTFEYTDDAHLLTLNIHGV